MMAHLRATTHPYQATVPRPRSLPDGWDWLANNFGPTCWYEDGKVVDGEWVFKSSSDKDQTFMFRSEELCLLFLLKWS